jgi:hypothetical protein
VYPRVLLWVRIEELQILGKERVLRIHGKFQDRMKVNHRGKVRTGNHLLVLIIGIAMMGIQPQ